MDFNSLLQSYHLLIYVLMITVVFAAVGSSHKSHEQQPGARKKKTAGIHDCLEDILHHEKTLQKMLACEQTLAKISCMAVSMDDLDVFLNDSLVMLGSALDVNRAYLFKFEKEENLLVAVHRWSNEKKPVEAPMAEAFPVDENRYLMKHLYKNKVVSFRDVKLIPEKKIKDLFLKSGVKSVLNVPLFDGGDLYGFLGFTDHETHMDWPSEALAIVKTAGQIIMSAVERKRTHDELEASREDYRTIIDAAGDIIFVCDIDTGRFMDVNNKLCVICGMTREEMLKRSLKEFCAKSPPNDYKTLRNQLKEWTGEQSITFDLHLWDTSGQELWYEAKIRRALVGGSESMLGVARNVTTRKVTDDAYRIQVSAINAATDQIVITDTDGGIEFVNPAFERETGYTMKEVIGRNLGSMFTSERDDSICDGLWAMIRAGGSFHGETMSSRKDGSLYVEDIAITPIMDDSGQVERFIAFKRNVTDKKVRERKLDHMAHHDPLTGLPNRLLFSDRLSQKLAHARYTHGSLAVMFLDLDRFKQINDTLGHDVGDMLLKEVGCRLRGILRDADTVARIGGDEFTVMAVDVKEPDDAAVIAKKILSSFAVPFVLGEHKLKISTSIGISMFPRDGEDVESMLRNADAAMYKAKENGRGTYRFSVESLNADALEKRDLIDSMKRALEVGEGFSLNYQPRIDLNSGAVLGVEALLRLKHPGLGTLSPAKFIPVAEEAGLMAPICDWVLYAACARNKSWQEKELPFMPISVNLSPDQLRQNGLSLSIKRTLTETGLEARYLDLEVPESIIMEDPASASAALMKLKRIGLNIVIDDFTGECGLDMLKNIPADTLKIDLNLIKGIEESEENAEAVGLIVSNAHSLNIKVVAEGVETIEQLQILRSLGCDGIQGYFISRPLPPEEFADFLLETSRLSETRDFIIGSEIKSLQTASL